MFKIPAKIEYVIDCLTKNGYEAYIVGGCVRDMLLGKVPYDFDITTSAKPEEVISLFEKTVPTGIKHGTVTVIVEKEGIEVTTFRSEAGYSDSRHPESVSFITSLEEDLSRRDFTVNAIAYNTSCGIKDYFGGIKDLGNHILKTVGDPLKRFSEDALRILRLFRFSATLGFDIEDKTLDAAIKLTSGLKNISRERIAVELKKAVCGENSEALMPLIDSGGLSFLNIEHNPNFYAIKKCRHNPNLAFFAFLYLSDSNVISVLDELKSSNSLKRYCDTLLKLLSAPTPRTKADIKELLKISDTQIFDDFLLFKSSAFKEDTSLLKEYLKEIKANNEPYLISHLCMNGEELKLLGISGKKIGATLEKLRKQAVIDPRINTKENLTKYIKNKL